MGRPMCNRHGCDKHAFYQVGLKGWALGHDRARTQPVRMWFGLAVCAAHKDEIGVRELVTPAANANIDHVLKMQGKEPLDWSKIELMRRELGGGQLLRPGVA